MGERLAIPSLPPLESLSEMGQCRPGLSPCWGCLVVTLFSLIQKCGLSQDHCRVGGYQCPWSLEGLSGVEIGHPLTDINPFLLPQLSGPFCRSGR